MAISSTQSGKTGYPNKATMLSIIIVNWNSLEYLRTCLQSILHSESIPGLEIIVVDNNSTIDPRQSIAAEFPTVKVIRSERNLGFSGANNLGFRYSSGRYLLFLNPDTVVIGSALFTLLRSFASLPDAGILGCKLLNSDGTLQTSCIQKFPTILNQLFDFELLRSRWPMWSIWGIAPLFANDPDAAAVEVVSGACLMMARDIFEQVGGFNETYFMYAEDVDLCYRTRTAGRTVYYTGQAQVVHHGGGASKARNGSAWIAVMQRRAILQFCRQLHGKSYAAAYRATTAFSSLVRLACLVFLRVLYMFTPAKHSFGSASSKWSAVLQWALGLDRDITFG